MNGDLFIGADLCCGYLCGRLLVWTVAWIFWRFLEFFGVLLRVLLSVTVYRRPNLLYRNQGIKYTKVPFI